MCIVIKFSIGEMKQLELMVMLVIRVTLLSHACNVYYVEASSSNLLVSRVYFVGSLEASSNNLL